MSKHTDRNNRAVAVVEAGRKDATLLASGARTANGNGDNVTTDGHTSAILFLDVTAVSGTSPTLDVHVRSKDPVSGKMVRVQSFTQKTAVGSEAIRVVGALGNELDVEYEVGGTAPSFTFSVGAVLEA